MNLFQLATKVLWLAPLALLGLIAAVMIARGLVRRYPLFFCYAVLLPARDAILLFLPYASPRYSNVYWWGEAGALLLSLGVVAETIWYLIEPYPFLRTAFKASWIVAILAALAALAMLFWNNGPGGADLALGQIILLERSARFLQVCMLIVVAGILSRLGLTWQHYSLGITAGFGLYAALDLTLLELRANLHVITDSTFVLLRSTSYNLAAVVWTYFFLRRPEMKPPGPVERLPVTNVADWNDVLTQRVPRWYQR
jgi:hypothetical protein